MSLDPSYLQYPKRRRGYDHDLYPWSSIFERPPVRWPDKRLVAVSVCISLEWFPITPADKPFRAPGHMQTPYPDYRHYTSRDYGTRIGFYRLLDALASAGVCGSVAVNAAVAERYPAVIDDIRAAGHEIIAHSTDMNGTIATGLSEDEERDLIHRSVETLERAAGARPRGWLSIARSESWATPQLLKDAGIDYVCDWVNDELPYRFNNGLINLPLNHELSDRQIIAAQQQSGESYAEQILDACQWLSNEAQAFGGRMLPLHVTPYILGLPYRIGAFEDLIQALSQRNDTWFAPAGEIVDSWAAQQ